MTLPLTYYEASASRPAPHPRLVGSTTVDVCIVGGGIAGCAAALHLAESGYRVALLEAERIGWAASGRSGGQVIPGYAIEQPALEAAVGTELARRMWALSVEAIDLLRAHITRRDIRCDWQPGQLQVGIKERHAEALAAWQQQLEALGYRSTRLLDRRSLRECLATDRYRVGLYDSNGGHLHPLNYTLGLAAAATRAGASIYESSPALAVTGGPKVVVRTATGQIEASHCVLCCNALLGDLAPSVHSRIMPVRTYIIATEPLGEGLASSMLSNNWGVTDTNFILDYFRRSADHRLLFGGRVSYSGRDRFDSAQATRSRMLNVFPQLRDTRIDFSWGGVLDITMNRAPDFGRVSPNVYYLQGFSGHGVALAGIAGKLVAEAVAGQAERFDLFGRIRHRNFPGGKLLRTPALVLAMLWYRLRDLL